MTVVEARIHSVIQEITISASFNANIARSLVTNTHFLGDKVVSVLLIREASVEKHDEQVSVIVKPTVSPQKTRPVTMEEHAVPINTCGVERVDGSRDVPNTKSISLEINRSCGPGNLKKSKNFRDIANYLGFYGPIKA